MELDMDQAISAVISAIVFVAFTAGLAQSIDAWPFMIIVGIVILLMGYGTFEVIRDAVKSRKSD